MFLPAASRSIASASGLLSTTGDRSVSALRTLVRPVACLCILGGVTFVPIGCSDAEDETTAGETAATTDEAPRFGPGAGSGTQTAPGTGTTAGPGGFAGPMGSPQQQQPPSGGMGDMMGMGQGDAPMNEEAATIQWTLPVGWSTASNTSSMRLATLSVDPTPGGEGDAGATPPLEVAVTSLRGMAGGLLPNVNRWRQQLGLPAIMQIDDQQIETVMTADGMPAQMVVMAQPEGSTADAADRQGMLVGIVQHAGDSYFFKMSGPALLTLEQQDEMTAFLGSVRFEQ